MSSLRCWAFVWLNDWANGDEADFTFVQTQKTQSLYYDYYTWKTVNKVYWLTINKLVYHRKNQLTDPSRLLGNDIFRDDHDVLSSANQAYQILGSRCGFLESSHCILSHRNVDINLEVVLRVGKCFPTLPTLVRNDSMLSNVILYGLKYSRTCYRPIECIDWHGNGTSIMKISKEDNLGVLKQITEIIKRL